jgi:Kef-type K+ transport system membrane component KefB
MLDTEAMIKQEKRSIVVDALFAGFYMAGLIICKYVGSEWYMIAMTAAGVGSRFTSIASRVRVMRWMGLVQKQEAVVEFLSTKYDQLAAAVPVSVVPGKNGVN